MICTLFVLLLLSNLIDIDDKYTQKHHINHHNNILYIFTDASMKDDYGGCGIYIEYHLINDILLDENADFDYIAVPLPDYAYNFIYVGTAYDINWIELIAIEYAIAIINKLPIKILSKYTQIHIVTDSENSYHWITGKCNATQRYVYDKVKSN